MLKKVQLCVQLVEPTLPQAYHTFKILSRSKALLESSRIVGCLRQSAAPGVFFSKSQKRCQQGDDTTIRVLNVKDWEIGSRIRVCRSTMDKEFQEKTMSAVVGASKEGEPIYNGHKQEPDEQKVFRNNLIKIGTTVENTTENVDNETLQVELKNFNDIKEEIIFQLTWNGACIYDKNAYGQTLLHAAFNEGCYDALCSALTNLTPNFNPANKDDVIHFHIACVTNHHLAAENFVKCGLDPNSPISLDYAEYYGLNPLEFAIQKNYSELFVTLLKPNGDLSRKNANGLTPLHMIYYSKLDKKGKYWLEQAFKHGNDTKFINSEDKYGVSHFHLCCITDERRFVQAFIDNGADVNDQVSLTSPIDPGFTPLHFAVINGCEKVTELLLNNGANPNKADKEGKTPLHLATEIMGEFSNSVAVVNIVRMLLAYRALPIIADVNGSTPLHVCFYNAKSQIFDIIKTLILEVNDFRVTTNYTDEHGLSLFHIACAKNVVDPIKNFLRYSGVNVNSRVSSGMYAGCTALHFAVMFDRCKKPNVLEVLLARGAKVNEKEDEFGNTPLGLACEKLHFPSIAKSIPKLLKYKASTVIPDKKGYTPLHKCLYSVDKYGFKMFDILVSKTKWGFDNYTDDQGLSLFHILCTTDDVDLVLHFLGFGVPADSPVSSGIYCGFTALHFAVMHNQKEVVEILLEEDVDVNRRAGKSAATPLHLACELNSRKFNRLFGRSSSSESNQMDIIELLLSRGADVNAKDACGMTPLHLACVIDNRYQINWSDYKLFKMCDTTRQYYYCDITVRLEKILKILIWNRADVNARTKDQSTALHILSKYKDLKRSEPLVKLLLNAGLEVDAVDAAGLTALHVAARYNSNVQLKSLLSHGANPHIKCNNSKTPAHFAADRIIYKSDEAEYFKERIETFCTLAEYGSDVDIIVAQGRVLLHEAMRARKYSFIYELLKYGADINMEDSHGNCSVSYLVEQPPDRKFLIVLTHVFFHMKWLEALKIPINPKVQNICDQLYARYESDLVAKDLYVDPNENYIKCRAELDMFRNVKIDSYTSLYDILKKDPHELIKHIKNINLVNIATDENIDKKFPLYGYLLKRQFKRALIRSEVTESADAALRNVLNINLPDLCCDLVLKYLKNDEIVDLVKAATLKRKPSDNSSENKTVRNLPKTESR